MARPSRRGLIAVAVVLVVLLAGAISLNPVRGRLALLVAGNPVPADAESVARGAALYGEFCAACHGDAGRGDGPAAAGLGSPMPDFTALNRPDPVLAISIHFGQGRDMPAWQDSLDRAELWDLVNHLQTIQAVGRGGNRQGWRPRPASND
jgi:mono/diheme cytochrome c family protein